MIEGGEIQKVKILDFHTIESVKAMRVSEVSQCLNRDHGDHLSILIIRDPYDYFDFKLYELIDTKKSILFTEDIIDSMENKSGEHFLGWLKGLHFFPLHNPQITHLDRQKRVSVALESLEQFDYVVPFEEIGIFLKNTDLDMDIILPKKRKFSFSSSQHKDEAQIFIEKDLALYDRAVELWSEIRKNNFKPLTEKRKERENLLKREAVKKRYKGIVGRITSHSIIGWAMKKEDIECVTIAIYKNGEPLHQTKADQVRQDIKERGIHPTGQCGFYVTFDRPTFSSGDLVEIRIIPDDVILDMGKDVTSFLRKRTKTKIPKEQVI